MIHRTPFFRHTFVPFGGRIGPSRLILPAMKTHELHHAIPGDPEAEEQLLNRGKLRREAMHLTNFLRDLLL